LPTLFMFWAAFIRLRNKKMKREEEENDRTLPE
jgi:hypothetical protein